MTALKRPASRPCFSCPYRRDVPSGVWSADEYDKLPLYDGETFEQPIGIFGCHQQDGRVCAGWAGCHDMDESLALRFAASREMTRADALATRDYVSPIPLFASGAEAAEHGRRELTDPGDPAKRTIENLIKKRMRRQ